MSCFRRRAVIMLCKLVVESALFAQKVPAIPDHAWKASLAQPSLKSSTASVCSLHSRSSKDLHLIRVGEYRRREQSGDPRSLGERQSASCRCGNCPVRPVSDPVSRGPRDKHPFGHVLWLELSAADDRNIFPCFSSE